MRVALVTPASTYASYGIPGDQADPPLGVLGLATILRADHDVRIFDGQLARCRPVRLADTVLAWGPDVVGFSTNFSTVVPAARRMAERIRAAAPEIPILFGGNFATFNWAELARAPYVDAIALSEAEGTVAALLDAVAGRGPFPLGSVDTRGPEPRLRASAGYLDDLDALPFCDFDLFDDPTRYVKSIVSSRGCPYTCAYCSTRQMWQGWRYRSADSTVAEMLALHERYGAERILFADDIFLVRRDRAEAICDRLVERGAPVAWGFSTRLETLRDDFVPRLAAAGVDAIFLGIESGSERVLRQMHRKYSKREILDRVALCRDHGITCTTSFIVGLPWETESDIEETFELMRAVETHRVLLNIFTPLSGTQASDDPEALGITFTEALDPERSVVGHGRVNFRTRHLSSETIRQKWLEGQGIVMQKARQRSAVGTNRLRYGLLDARGG